MAKKNSKDEIEQELENPQITELTQDLKRIQADFMNYKRRAEQEKGELLDFAKSRVVRDFLSVRDSFDRELTNRPTEIKDSSWASTIDSIRTSFDAVLKNLGVERFDSLGQTFDPHIHDAIVMEDGEGEHEVVVDEMQSGYKLGETILRHAMVKVGHTNEDPYAKADGNVAEEGKK